MSYGGRPAPRPGELFNYGPPRPSRGNFNTAYARSEAGGSRLPPPQRPPYPEPSYHHPTASVQRPPQRSYGNPQYYPPPSAPSYNRAPPSNGPYNNFSSSSSSSSEYGYPPSSFMPPRRPSIPNMRDDRSRPARELPSSNDRSYDFRDDHYSGRDPRQRPNNYSSPPQRGYRPSRSEASYSDDEQPAQSNQQQQGSGEAEGAWSWNTLKKTVWGDSTKDASQSQDQYPTPEDQVPADSQNTLWARIANVGASFQKKINGDEGYASDATDYEGESHLIRIMKKHHVENAESAHDLPDWLFTQEELEEAYSGKIDRSLNDPYRAGNGRRGRHDLDDDGDDGYSDGVGRGERGGGGGLSDIYESVDRNRAGYHSREPSKQSFDSGYGSSSASRRPKRFEDEPIDRFEEQLPPGRNRMGSQHHPRPPSPNRSYRSQSNEPFRRPMNPMGPPSSNSEFRSISGGGRSMAGGGRRFDPNPQPFRPIASGPSPKSTYDYSRPSGQDDRYPSPQPKFRPPPPLSSSGMRPQRR